MYIFTAKLCYTLNILYLQLFEYIIFIKFDCLISLYRNYEHNYEIKIIVFTRLFKTQITIKKYHYNLN